MLVDIRNVSKSYPGNDGEVRALDDFSLSVEAGQFAAVQGPSGCGKTTLLLIAGGLLHPDKGEVRVAGADPYRLASEKRAAFRAENIGFVFQQFHLVPYLTVLENVMTASIALDGAGPGVLDRAHELVARFGLEHRMSHVPARLSTGERQRTALARALFNRPKVVLADEPTGNLDRENAVIVLQHLAEFAREGAVLLVTHDTAALEYANTVSEIRNGRLAAVAAT